MSVNGIDVASYQSTAYNTAGLDFVMVKATESTSYVNPHHAGQVATARAAGLVVGHYHFARPGDVNEQVSYFISRAGVQSGDVLCLDWEDGGVDNAWKDAFIKAVQLRMPDHRVILYCNRDFWLNRDKTSVCGDGLWIADPDAPVGHPRVEHPWVLHQYSDAGGLDRNVGNFTSRGMMRTWATKGAIAPAHPSVSYVPFPGSAWFHVGRRDPIITAMHKRLVAEGCNHYRSSTNQDVIGSGDVASYEAWQRKCGFRGKSASWPPGKTTWDKLKVPRS